MVNKMEELYIDDKIRLYDEDIREPLFDHLEQEYGKIRFFEEKIIGKSRADVIAICCDRIVGVEIKSDVDTYERLKSQVRNYNKFCDFNYIAVGRSHKRHVEKHVPKEWGILVVYVEDEEICIMEQRPATLNPKMKQDIQISMMWRPELQRILTKNKLPQYKQKSKKFVQQKLIEKMEWRELKLQMCEELFERDYTLWDEELELYKQTSKRK